MNPFILLNWIAPISVVPFRPRHYGPVDIRWGHFHLVASIGNFPQSVGSFERKGQPLELGVATFALKEFAGSQNQSTNQSYLLPDTRLPINFLKTFCVDFHKALCLWCGHKNIISIPVKAAIGME